ncbi:hypothetical protein ABIA33_004713 [Streptacidiphilus sp. MAP12-16]|jgi:hypothetical protein|uniref:hypothetical protein n=1 Tax=Streptacidiphilus sp. MAP12-16 TaxID=3156300 RepID=UPI003519681B
MPRRERIRPLLLPEGSGRGGTPTPHNAGARDMPASEMRGVGRTGQMTFMPSNWWKL